MNNQEVSTAYVGSTEIKECRLGSQLVLAPNGDALWYKANEVPTLDLRFAENESLVDATTGANLVDFSRASGGTYIDSQGVIRNATTNLLLRSEEFDNASWTLSGILAFGSGSIANAATAPNGTLTADKVVESSGGTTHVAAQQATISSGTVYTLSVYAKAAERTRVALYFGGAGGAAQGIIVNLTNGTFAANIVAAPTSYSITPAGNGWYRISITATSVGTAATHTVYICNDSNAFSYSGDGTSGIYIWGAQLEQSSTVGEYIPTGATINSAPRFDHNPTTGESLGLLVEEARTNLLTYTEQLDNPIWGVTRILPFGSGSIANAAIAPDGTLTADKLVEDTSASTTHYFSQNFAAAATTNYTFSIFLKAAERSWVVFLTGGTTFGSHGLYVDLLNGIAGTIIGTPISTKVDKYSNGWVRVSITQVSTVLGTGVLQVRTATGDAGQVYTGDGTSGIYAWGAQVEAGAFPTSYIKNVDTPGGVTRTADIAQITGTNFSSWYRQDEGTVFAEGFPNADTGTARVLADFNNNTAFNRISLTRSTTLKAQLFVNDNNVSQVNIQTTNNAAATYKAAGVFKVNDFAVSTDGSSAATDTLGTVPVISQINFGARADGSNPLNGRIKRLTFWPQRLPNATLQSITQ